MENVVRSPKQLQEVFSPPGNWETGGASFKEVCEVRPNGSCQEFCIDSEIQARRCLDGRPCCLPTVHVPEVDPTTPKEH
ncbi:LOW QUALITY PROTEIN: beta-defensin 108B [Balaenoptera acutorostrata]|uniref:LOW QUALITY PROTEIN: beta-defensin 108B n=1 Tax=Balaenoptera acutorostrata TaxID=9767 RepID=A0A452CM16_BALAC|nr:LOW QUALITY PROTEIN: beta-defensin 108B [Balaenoptera acutorostrata]